ncbi:MAG: rppH [Rhodospirillaceae bacterium]|nr:MAG: rppH [Rhodospirillaceae bacterium]
MTGHDEIRPYRLGVGIILVNRRGEVFVGQRIDTSQPAWQMPQGGIEDGEDPRAAALRELREEAGTDKAEVVAETTEWVTYDLPADVSCTVWGGRYRGQKQKWYVMRFLGCDADIAVAATESPEFSSWRWMDLDSVVAHIVAFKRDLYVQVIAELRDAIRAAATGWQW